MTKQYAKMTTKNIIKIANKAKKTRHVWRNNYCHIKNSPHGII